MVAVLTSRGLLILLRISRDLCCLAFVSWMQGKVAARSDGLLRALAFFSCFLLTSWHFDVSCLVLSWGFARTLKDHWCAIARGRWGRTTLAMSVRARGLTSCVEDLQGFWLGCIWNSLFKFMAFWKICVLVPLNLVWRLDSCAVRSACGWRAFTLAFCAGLCVCFILAHFTWSEIWNKFYFCVFGILMWSL